MKYMLWFKSDIICRIILLRAVHLCPGTHENRFLSDADPNARLSPLGNCYCCCFWKGEERLIWFAHYSKPALSCFTFGLVSFILTILYKPLCFPTGSQEQPEWSGGSAGNPQRKGQQLLCRLWCSELVTRLFSSLYRCVSCFNRVHVSPLQTTLLIYLPACWCLCVCLIISIIVSINLLPLSYQTHHLNALLNLNWVVIQALDCFTHIRTAAPMLSAR